MLEIPADSKKLYPLNVFALITEDVYVDDRNSNISYAARYYIPMKQIITSYLSQIMKHIMTKFRISLVILF